MLPHSCIGSIISCCFWWQTEPPLDETREQGLQARKVAVSKKLHEQLVLGLHLWVWKGESRSRTDVSLIVRFVGVTNLEFNNFL